MLESFEVLVTGATGQQGGAVARRLLKKGHRVRAFTRKPDSPAAKELEQLGAELAIGNFDDLASIERAAEGVDAVDEVEGRPAERRPRRQQVPEHLPERQDGFLHRASSPHVPGSAGVPPARGGGDASATLCLAVCRTTIHARPATPPARWRPR